MGGVMRDARSAPGRVIPPVPTPLPEGLSTRALICAYATDVLATYPERAFEDVAVVRPFCGRLSSLINAPDEVDNDAVLAHPRNPQHVRPMVTPSTPAISVVDL
jgi:hypothetical protein